jgi:ATP-dependent helicase/nuclease subunit A
VSAPATPQPTEEQQKAANPTKSVWVSASAGTGKTTVLTDRVLSLLLQGTPPTRLLCLTFTKAAAAEMMSRVVRRLSRWATMLDGDLEHDLRQLTGRVPEARERVRARQLFAGVLDAPGGLKIQTIHAFCQSLLARFPLEAGVAPHFTVIDDVTAEELRREAREAVLARTRTIDLGGPVAPALAGALGVVTDHVQEQEFAELLAGLISERGRVRRMIALHGGVDGLIAVIAARLGVTPDRQIEVVRAALVTLEPAHEVDLRRAAAALASGNRSDQQYSEAIARFLDQRATRHDAYPDYRSVFFTDQGSRRKSPVSKPCAAKAPDVPGILVAEAERLDCLEEQLRSATILDAGAAATRRCADRRL